MRASPVPDVPYQDEDTLAHAIRVLRRRWLTVVLPLLACIGVAVGHQLTQTPQYEATASVAFGTAHLPSAALQVDVSSDNPEREAATNVLIARSPEVAAAVREELGSTVSVGELLDAVRDEAGGKAGTSHKR